MVVLVAILLIPILEIACFAAVGRLLGLWPTLGLVLLSAVTGSVMLQQSGRAILARARNGLEMGDRALIEMLDGLGLALAALLLLAPGFVTDGLALLLLVPPFRRHLARRMLGPLRRRVKVEVFGGRPRPSGPPPPPFANPLDPRNPPPTFDAQEPVDPQEPVDSPPASDGPALSESRWAPKNSRFRRP